MGYVMFILCSCFCVFSPSIYHFIYRSCIGTIDIILFIFFYFSREPLLVSYISHSASAIYTLLCYFTLWMGFPRYDSIEITFYCAILCTTLHNRLIFASMYGIFTLFFAIFASMYCALYPLPPP